MGLWCLTLLLPERVQTFECSPLILFFYNKLTKINLLTAENKIGKEKPIFQSVLGICLPLSIILFIFVELNFVLKQQKIQSAQNTASRDLIFPAASFTFTDAIIPIWLFTEVHANLLLLVSLFWHTDILWDIISVLVYYLSRA